MPDHPMPALDFLKEQFARLHRGFDRRDADLLDLKVRVSTIEMDLGHLRIGLGQVNGRIDRIEVRLTPDRTTLRPHRLIGDVAHISSYHSRPG